MSLEGREITFGFGLDARGKLRFILGGITEKDFADNPQLAKTIGDAIRDALKKGDEQKLTAGIPQGVREDATLHPDRYAENSRRWKVGDLVIAMSDAKEVSMLMRVIGYDGDLCITIYEREAVWIKRIPKHWTNDIKYLLDPVKFGLLPPEANDGGI